MSFFTFSGLIRINIDCLFLLSAVSIHKKVHSSAIAALASTGKLIFGAFPRCISGIIGHFTCGTIFARNNRASALKTFPGEFIILLRIIEIFSYKSSVNSRGFFHNMVGCGPVLINEFPLWCNRLRQARPVPAFRSEYRDLCRGDAGRGVPLCQAPCLRECLRD